MSHVVSFYTVKNMQAIIELKLSFLQNMNIEAFGVLQYGKQVKMNHRTKVKKEGSSYQCTYCPFKTKWVASFHRHKKIHTNELHKCDQCELNVKTSQ